MTIDLGKRQEVFMDMVDIVMLEFIRYQIIKEG